MSDHDLRRQVREIRAALQRFDREQLIEILTHLFGHYVLEGGAADAGPLPSLKAGDFEGLGFAEVVERLQLRLNLPELRLLEVQGGQVSVRVEGRLHPLRAAAPEPVVPPAPAATPPAAPSRATVQQRIAEALALPEPTSPGRSAREELDALMRPSTSTDGRSVTARGGVVARPAPAGAPTATPGAPAAAPAAPAAPAAAPARAPEKPAEEPGSRFSLLEID